MAACNLVVIVDGSDDNRNYHIYIYILTFATDDDVVKSNVRVISISTPKKFTQRMNQLIRFDLMMNK